MKHPVGQSRNGAYVYVELIGSPAATHIAQQPQLLALAQEMLNQVSVLGAEANIEYDMKRSLGYNFVIATTEQDTILYGRLIKDDIYTRFVKNGKAIASNFLTLTLLRRSDNSYELSDIWIGRLRPPRPGSANETAESRPYWSTHAAVLDSKFMQIRGITRECPY